MRTTGAATNTVSKSLQDIGLAFQVFHDVNVRRPSYRRIRCDEIWSFCYAKGKNVPGYLKGQLGYCDIWTWVALDPDTKLCVSWFVGLRHAQDAKAFMTDVADRLLNRVQLTTDGHTAYFEAVEDAFGGSVDYAMLVKLCSLRTKPRNATAHPCAMDASKPQSPGRQRGDM